MTIVDKNLSLCKRFAEVRLRRLLSRERPRAPTPRPRQRRRLRTDEPIAKRAKLRHNSCLLLPTTANEVEPFIHQRLCTAGHERQDVFSPEALQRIAVYSRGIPGRINSICDRALLQAASLSPSMASAEIVEEVSRALQLVTISMNHTRAPIRRASCPGGKL